MLLVVIQEVWTRGVSCLQIHEVLSYCDGLAPTVFLGQYDNPYQIIKPTQWYSVLNLDTNFETTLESTTLNGLSQQHTLFSIFNFVVILFLTIFMVYWQNIEAKLVVECSD
jgi:hypothetical protein